MCRSRMGVWFEVRGNGLPLREPDGCRQALKFAAGGVGKCPKVLLPLLRSPRHLARSPEVGRRCAEPSNMRGPAVAVSHCRPQPLQMVPCGTVRAALGVRHSDPVMLRPLTRRCSCSRGGGGPLNQGSFKQLGTTWGGVEGWGGGVALIFILAGGASPMDPPPSSIASNHVRIRVLGTFFAQVGEAQSKLHVREWLHSCQERYTQALQNETLGLPAIRQCSGVPATEPLFDTFINFQNHQSQFNSTALADNLCMSGLEAVHMESEDIDHSAVLEVFFQGDQVCGPCAQWTGQWAKVFGLGVVCGLMYFTAPLFFFYGDPAPFVPQNCVARFFLSGTPQFVRGRGCAPAASRRREQDVHTEATQAPPLRPGTLVLEPSHGARQTAGAMRFGAGIESPWAQ